MRPASIGRSPPAIVRACRRLGHRVLDDAPAELVRAPGKPVAAPAAPLGEGWAYPPIVQTAMRNGWVYMDLTGAGEENQWGPEGGRADRSGLTMAELSLTTPPAGWYEDGPDTVALSGTHYPWEVLGWKHPGDGWIAPKLPMKRASADAVPAKDEAPVPLLVESAGPLLNEGTDEREDRRSRAGERRGARSGRARDPQRRALGGLAERPGDRGGARTGGYVAPGRRPAPTEQGSVLPQKGRHPQREQRAGAGPSRSRSDLDLS